MMKRWIAWLVAIMLMLSNIPALAAKEVTSIKNGCWKTEDGAMLITYGDQIYEWYDHNGALLSHGRYLLNHGSLTLFDGARDYIVTWQDEPGFMTLKDVDEVVTVWCRVAEESKESPFLGVWTQVTDDLTVPVMELYEDGIFASSDLFHQGEKDALGAYLADEWLILYPNEYAAYTLTTDKDGLTLRASGRTLAFKAAPMPTSIAVQDKLIGAWAKDESTEKLFFTKNTIKINGISYRYTLLGSQMLIADEDGTMLTRMTLGMDSGALTLQYDQDGKTISTTYQKD